MKIINKTFHQNYRNTYSGKEVKRHDKSYCTNSVVSNTETR